MEVEIFLGQSVKCPKYKSLCNANHHWGVSMKIFIIEDEPAIREELVQLLQKYSYQCDSSDDFHHIVQAALSSGANLILLDINLPYQDGFQVCREIRQKSNLPIIVLTSRNSDFDELMSLNIGADDYIAKPYNAQILLARIQKLLARTYEVQDNIVLTHKGLTLNLLKAEISYQGNKKSLTKNELGILRLLMVNKGNIIPRDAIIDELWQSEQFIDENTLNVNVSVCCCCIAEPPGNHGWRGDFTACRR